MGVSNWVKNKVIDIVVIVVFVIIVAMSVSIFIRRQRGHKRYTEIVHQYYQLQKSFSDLIQLINNSFMSSDEIRANNNTINAIANTTFNNWNREIRDILSQVTKLKWEVNSLSLPLVTRQSFEAESNRFRELVSMTAELMPNIDIDEYVHLTNDKIDYIKSRLQTISSRVFEE